MRVAVLNGSPKGDTSVTMQYVAFLRKCFPEHEFRISNIAQNLSRIEKDESAFSEVLETVNSSDVVLWAFPLYVCLVHSNYKRFIELVFERGVGEQFRGKYAAVLTTSIHFYDHTAHNYIQGICDDLDMRFYGGYSADMYDLLKEDEQDRLAIFAENLFESVQLGDEFPKTYPSIVWNDFEYVPGPVSKKIDLKGKKVLILTDADEGDANLVGMVARLCRSFEGDVEGVNLNDLSIKGGCLGCLHCAYDNKCVYEGKDDYIEFFNSKVKTADILIWAGSIKDRYLSSRWKLFFDREFFNTHCPVFMGKQVTFIISGPFGQLPNLREIMDAYVELQMANHVGYVTDESGDAQHIDALLDGMARRIAALADMDYVKPPSFLSVGGKKIFRDDVWGRMRAVFHADHECYKRLGIYDFPQYDYRTRVRMAIMTLLLKIPNFREEFARRTKDEMIKPLQKVLGD